MRDAEQRAGFETADFEIGDIGLPKLAARIGGTLECRIQAFDQAIYTLPVIDRMGAIFAPDRRRRRRIRPIGFPHLRRMDRGALDHQALQFRRRAATEFDADQPGHMTRDDACRFDAGAREGLLHIVGEAFDVPRPVVALVRPAVTHDVHIQRTIAALCQERQRRVHQYAAP